ncbi:ANTAR domain-containing protein [Cellulomonas sp. zg-ZUI199]|uniref:ANTAR domain-containing protein n=1 Tax=Cellulomonas wangleii TaxID=2816956 RepID=A0ABX8DA43_9CELL|nr:ANTAR domain-containing protein [Cellulomonas wangleii]MBO0924728.1 ANTAR domain-containing protein [Cellulomonas wangleii]QVI62912.1 ANTAR domain-containing protein [Cellulomonas wangleii]
MTAVAPGAATAVVPPGMLVVLALLRRVLEHELRRGVDLRVVAEVAGRPPHVVSTPGSVAPDVPWPEPGTVGPVSTAVRHGTTCVAVRTSGTVDWSDVTDDLRVTAGVLSGMIADRADADDLRQDVADLTAAMRSREVIDQAIGVVVAHRRCSPERALEVLRTTAQRRDEKLSEVATRVVAQAAGTRPVSGTPFQPRKHVGVPASDQQEAGNRRT